ncbi:hypothetical protein [Streptomyces sp. NPDC050287]|uniref:hypothetical protein n=1 Tax=Streptomyces sp. NPDC050287 TaxID=3365608 RepID=UPI0037B45641
MTSVLLCLAVAAGVQLPSVSPAYADSCAAGSQGPDFPVRARIHGGPGVYQAGGGYGVWYLDLTNTTDRTCGNIHPVVILVDERRVLEPGQPRLEFYEETGNGTGSGGVRAHPVPFERTDADELVGVFAGERDRFPGFTVGPGKTLSVKVRLAVGSDAVANQVTANAAVVQRHHDEDDGDWVGQSNDYRFRIDSEADAPMPPEPSAQSPWQSPSQAPSPSPSQSQSPSQSPPLSPSQPPRVDVTAPGTSRLPFADELARTGLGPTTGALAAALALLLVAAGTLLLVRRRR